MTKYKSSNQLIAALKRILHKQRAVLFIAGIMTTITAVVMAAIVMSVAANLILLPAWLKITVLSIVGLLSAYLFVRFAISRLFGGSIDNVALMLEDRNPALKGRLIAAIQFARQDNLDSFSSDLLEWTEKQAVAEADKVNFNEAVSFSSPMKSLRNLTISSAVAILLLVIFPGFFSYSYEVFSNPTTLVAPPIAYQVTPFPGNTEWVKYRDLNIGAAIVGVRIPKSATLHYKMAGGSWQEETFELSRQPLYTATVGDSLQISFTLRQINKSLDYYIESGRVKTEMQSIDVVDRPRVNEIKLSVFYPDYTGLEPTVIDENSGSFSAVMGSRVNLEIGANLPIEQSWLVFEDSSQSPLKVEGKKGATSLVVEKSTSYHIRLLDRLGELNPDPIEYYITSVPDEYPSIDVLYPGFDANLTDEMFLPIKLRIFDDYGFSSLVMKYIIYSQRTKSDEHVAVLHYSERIKTEGEVEFKWDMEQLNLFPGDYVEYYFEVADNDRISGPKISATRHYIARVPSLEEIISETEGESIERVNETEQLIKSGKELSERLKNVSRKLQAEMNQPKNQKWQQKKELEAILDKNADMLDKIEEAAEQMEQSVEKIAENNLMSREILEKLAEIQKLYEDVATPEMKKAQKNLMDALKNMDQNELKKALEDYKTSQKEMMQRLERTLALLKKMQIEQKMEAMLRKVEEMAKKQEEINKQTETASKPKMKQLSESEDELKKSLENLKEEVKELEKLLAEMKDSPPNEAQKFSESVKESDADKNMSEMSKSLNNQNKKNAQKEGKKSLSKLLQMLDQMQQSMAAMKSGDMEKVKGAMRAAIDDANYISHNQEELLKRAGEVSPNSVMLREMAKAQQDLLKSCNGLKNRIAEIGKESPFIAAELQSLVKSSLDGMELSIDGFDQKKGFQATQHQREAMSNLNKTSVRLMESLKQQKQCDKGGNCSKPTSKLQSLCDKQNMLNQQTQKECNNPGGQKPSSGSGSRDALGRLAGEQATIRKSMEELNREFGGSRQVLGRLNDIAREMKEIEDAMAGGDASQEMIERQLKVYSRMLSASRSLYKKDFTEQRKSSSPTTNAFFVPPQLTDDILNDKVKLDDRLRQYLGEDYPRQYEKQIKAYFKVLLQQESTNR